MVSLERAAMVVQMCLCANYFKAVEQYAGGEVMQRKLDMLASAVNYAEEMQAVGWSDCACKL